MVEVLILLEARRTLSLKGPYEQRGCVVETNEGSCKDEIPGRGSQTCLWQEEQTRD